MNYLKIVFGILATICIVQEGFSQAVPSVNFAEKSYYFGAFARNQGLKTHTFEFKNTGTEPVTIAQVKSSCGCTATDWSRQPVLPGKTGQIKVQFNPQKFSGYFSKSVAVHISKVSEPVNLQITGRIIINNKVNDDFTYFVGDLKADTDVVDFGELEAGSGTVSRDIRFINVMRDTIRLVASSIPDGISMTQSREVIPPGGNSKMTFKYNPSEHQEWGSIDKAVKLEVTRSAKKETRKLPVRAAVIDDFSKMDAGSISEAANISLEGADKFVLEPGQSGQWVTKKLKIQNTGQSDLIIRKVEIDNQKIKIKKVDEQIAPGKWGTIVLSYQPDAASGSVAQAGELVVWNNSPEHYRFTIPIVREEMQ